MPFIDQPQFDVSAIQEALRRRAEQTSSYAGIPGGAPVANQTSSSNPLMMFAQRRMAEGGSQVPTNMTGEARNQLAQSKPGERELIIKALIRTLRDTAPQGQTMPQLPIS